MPQFTYETDEATFTFPYQDAVDVLSSNIKEYQVEDDSMLLTWLLGNSSNGQQDIAINAEATFEMEDYVGRIVYLIRNLLIQGKGTVHCKQCDRNIPASNIKKKQTTPFDAHDGLDKKTRNILKKELGLKGRIRFPASGGTIFLCDKGHELFRTKDWIT
ncbi:MAG: hypothetical protein JRJ38_10460 [Deltaproteobacteria bacterium]|nr:hypothetical protein [Deltaproteobacteria bacterium]